MGSAEHQIIDVEPYVDCSPKYTPIEKILKYRKQGLSLPEIGGILGISKQAVHQRLQPYAEELENLEDYKEHRADILALKGRQILKNIDNDRLEKASAYQLAGMYGILYDKERLERGESTHNIASIHSDIQELKALKLAQKHKIQEDQD